MKVIDVASTIAWYDENAEQYAKNIAPYPANPDLIEKFVNYLDGVKVLDAGCAAGRDSILLSEQGLDVTGLDLSAGLLRIAKAAYPRISFVQGDFLSLPFEDNVFDGVWSHASLVHMQTKQDTEDALAEFYRVLNINGIIYIYVKSSEKEMDVVSDKLSSHSRFFRYYAEDEMASMLTSQGFEVIESLEQNDPAGRNDFKWLVFYARKV